MKTLTAVVIIADRHCDVDVVLFDVVEEAVAWARRKVREYAKHNTTPARAIDEELTGPMRADGWVYYGNYSSEGDCIRVVLKSTYAQGEVPA